MIIPLNLAGNFDLRLTSDLNNLLIEANSMCLEMYRRQRENERESENSYYIRITEPAVILTVSSAL
jgi:hypothetical protein